MRRFCLCVFTLTLAAAAAPSDLVATGRLRFEPAGKGRFVASGLRYQFAFDSQGITYGSGSVVQRLHFIGASQRATVEPLNLQRSVSNRFVGNDPSRWKAAIPNYDRLLIAEIYPSIDLVYYGTAGSLEYDMNVK